MTFFFKRYIIYVERLYLYKIYIMSKFWNRAWNTALIPWRTLKTAALCSTDVVKTTVWTIQDASSVIINTTNKIADLFSDELKRRQQALNIPVAAWVWLAWAVELAIAPLVNWVVNAWKTSVNLVTNARKSTFWSLITTKPVWDMSFNTIKTKKWKIHIDTGKHFLSTDPWTKYWWYLTKSSKSEYLEEKKRKIEERIAALGA